MRTKPLLLVALLTLPQQLHASASSLGYSGRLFDSDGQPIHTQAQERLTLWFSFFASALGEHDTVLYEENHDLQIYDGYFAVVLGEVDNDLFRAMFDANDALFLQVQVAGDTPLTPRQALSGSAWLVANHSSPQSVDLPDSCTDGDIIAARDGSWSCEPRSSIMVVGPIGPQGPQGLQGPQGPAGKEGPRGDQGPEGAACAASYSPAGEITIACGSTSVLLPPGPQGAQGAQGPRGAPADPCMAASDGAGNVTITCGDTNATLQRGPQGPALTATAPVAYLYSANQSTTTTFIASVDNRHICFDRDGCTVRVAMLAEGNVLAATGKRFRALPNDEWLTDGWTHSATDDQNDTIVSLSNSDNACVLADTPAPRTFRLEASADVNCTAQFVD